MAATGQSGARGGSVRLYTHAACSGHDPGSGHRECPERLAAISAAVDAAGLTDRLARCEPQPAPRAALERVHAASYVEMILGLRGRSRRLDADTAVSPGSVDAALHAAGAALDATAAVLAGDAHSAFCAVRPPGHHAERGHAMGFCLFNNAAVAAAAALAGPLQRVLVFDPDVHHGNGTQHLFYRSPAVYYISIHQYPFYPGTGAAGERGAGPGSGYTLNLPLPAGAGDDEYLAATERRVLPALRAFAPQLVIVSAGFDAHRRDLLGMMRVSTSGFTAMYRLLLDELDRLGVPHLFVLEGGYHLAALGECVAALLTELTNRYARGGSTSRTPNRAGRPVPG